MPSRRSVAILFAYGAVLAVLGVTVAGAGHGSYLLIWLAGSPFSILGVPAAIIASVLQWGLLALVQRMLWTKFRVVIGFLVLHYIVAAFFLFRYSGEVSDWEYLRRSPYGVHLTFALGLTWYVIGQCFVWGTSLPRELRR